MLTCSWCDREHFPGIWHFICEERSLVHVIEKQLVIKHKDVFTKDCKHFLGDKTILISWKGKLKSEINADSQDAALNQFVHWVTKMFWFKSHITGIIRKNKILENWNTSKYSDILGDMFLDAHIG